ncbi:class I SAM-dependent methyltransferase [Sphingomonas baiyangensis]|uniref:Class I SAM-dependent methyltransferase n=1 Tax=Sphingomonas baiyangensis TaxID=2572576 RepID=A0A4U1L8I8_9SPHN|nr:class I SAM-dependent methyltransferase [Sphingomonas baiyangensis]TKD53281.1 class I SAM-dependent methyltransferase [Sphingomonas baiyangensis]
MITALVSLSLLLSAFGQERDAPFVPSPEPVVEAMLDIAEVGPDDLLIDLGSGDGRIAIAAGKRGAEALGIDIDSRLVARANWLAREAELSPRVRFRRENLFDTRLRDADVLTLYLMPDMNLKLRPRILNEMRPGSRVVAHAFDMGDWTHDGFTRVDERRVYLWIVPAVAGGQWRMALPGGGAATLTIEQRYQRISGTLDAAILTDAMLRGDRITFTANGRRFEGLVGDRTIEPAPGDAGGWRAER